MKTSTILLAVLAALGCAVAPAQSGIISSFQKFIYSQEVSFYFFTKEMLDSGDKSYHQINSRFNFDAESLKKAGFDNSVPTKILIHGFANSAWSSTVKSIREAYHKADRYNVIIVDWSPVDRSLNYLFTKAQLGGVGGRIADLIDFLVNEKLVVKEELHLIGHSLGAHVAGFAGKKSATSGKVGRITGLDPARPMFNMYDESSHLAKSDASLVDVIHTSASFLGIQASIGHIDFYPNGGKSQPGCSFLDFVGVCAHGRSHELFTESILNSKAFLAYRCEDEWDALHQRCNAKDAQDPEDWAVMGNSLQFSKLGSYYLETKGSSPFSKTKDD